MSALAVLPSEHQTQILCYCMCDMFVLAVLPSERQTQILLCYYMFDMLVLDQCLTEVITP